VELKDNQKQKIVEIVSKKTDKTILPEWKTDKKIIAGVIVKINDNVIDMSIKNRISKLSKSLMLK
jgi:F-type H+-transporting ATPase subunit delta